MSADSKDREVLIQRTVPFARELVWKAMTEKEHAQRWWGPDGFTIEGMALDLKVGGTWSFDMVGPDGTRYPNLSVFTEISPPAKLVYDQGDGKTVWFVATVLLEAKDGGTLVTLHQLYPDRAARDLVVEKYGAIDGGIQHLAKMETYIRKHF
jgi:uncharacterized protein YndB with AHSA1/START domain